MAAEIAVPLPFSTPVMVVDKVMAGVEVAVATVPAKPLADTTETVVTVPDVAGAELVQAVPLLVSTLPAVPGRLDLYHQMLHLMQSRGLTLTDS